MKDKISNCYLSTNQNRFALLIEPHTNIVKFWDFEKSTCDYKNLKVAMRTLSHGERIMAQFFASVWAGHNLCKFDLIEAAQVLDDKRLMIVQNWLKAPFFP